MLLIAVRGLCALLLLSLCPGCLVYSNRVSYSAHTDASPGPTQAAVSPVKVIVHLQRESTAGVLPFVFTRGEKGDYSFSVQLFGPSLLPYQGGLIRAFSIVSPAGVLFQRQDSTFVRDVPATPHPGPTKPYPDSFSRFYESPYVIALADSCNRLSFTLDYLLITTDGKREPYHLEQPLRVDRDKGFALPSI
jgi:hypothetical protein